MKKYFLLFFANLILLSANTQSTFIVTTNSSTPPEMELAIDYVTDIWGQYLNSTVPIKINITYVPLGSATLGVCIPNFKQNFPNAPMEDVWYPTSLANSIAGTEVNVGEIDMDIFINAQSNWYFGTDSNPSNQYDFVSVLLHEMIHGLGGLALAYVEDDIGSFGSIPFSNLLLPTPQFGWPETLEGHPSIWDIFLVDSEGELLTDTLLYSNPSALLAAEFRSNDIFFSGANATTANNGVYPKIYAPADYTIGSSIHHFNETTFPASSGEELFTPLSSLNEISRPGPMLLGALMDLGWSINTTVGIEKIEENPINIYPNPSNGMITIDCECDEKAIDFKMMDMLGNVIVDHLDIGLNQIDQYANGTYIITGILDGKMFSERFVLIH